MEPMGGVWVEGFGRDDQRFDQRSAMLLHLPNPGTSEAKARRPISVVADGILAGERSP